MDLQALEQGCPRLQHLVITTLMTHNMTFMLNLHHTSLCYLVLVQNISKFTTECINNLYKKLDMVIWFAYYWYFRNVFTLEVDVVQLIKDNFSCRDDTYDWRVVYHQVQWWCGTSWPSDAETNCWFGGGERSGFWYWEQRYIYLVLSFANGIDFKKGIELRIGALIVSDLFSLFIFSWLLTWHEQKLPPVVPILLKRAGIAIFLYFIQ